VKKENASRLHSTSQPSTRQQGLGLRAQATAITHSA
jgi:hypothetical protein